ncbi:sigma-54-dependent Fis family transcriptional regulator [Robertmurraya korlensis]|uniref:sigma-54-dependent Fis family transcriptional regulator n=1 Tax=Robertmurraya korlensis TaxID=519977 RepID=UPI00203B11BB|nr:sigma-54-dependent Fis family transcriptional regulator [Robertmurraya korlensis]MCM3600061.1 sigma-54-dependent Fis family transcriptional regulator [Robertmurraya korlensis]
MDTTFYFDTWKRFVKEGVLDSARLNQRILESWYRCKTEKVNPYLNKAHHVLTQQELDGKKAENALLIELATPFLKKMDQPIKESGMMGLLVDPDGYVLSLSGNDRTLMNARRINFVEGVQWTETEVGTNAIGTALQAKEPVIIHGPEHYSVASHQWSCSATPIIHEDGSLLGVIDVSCPVESSHPFMIGMVTSISYAIEKEIASRSYKRELKLIQHATVLAETYKNHLFIVCNYNNMILSASKSILEKNPRVIGMNVFEFLHNKYNIDLEMPFFLKEDNSRHGTCFFLSKIATEQSRIFVPHSTNSFSFQGEAGVSQVFQNTLQKVKLVAPSDTSVFITGETGTGKELIARAIHDNSPRKNGPFISLNCGAIPKDLMESELFGYVEGAFTGARKQGYKGKFEQANKGTIFLDEIGEIPQTMQVALLRVLQERKVTPIGSTKEVPLDVRVITATHRDLRQLVGEGDFREDLFYRLHVYPIEAPALRDRKEDIPHLARYICQQSNWNIDNLEDVVDRLIEYEWPGNIRELTNVLERVSIMLPQWHGSLVGLINEVLPTKSLDILPTEENELVKPLKPREKIQRDLMLDALKKTKGNVTAAAKLLDIPRSTFYKRLQRFSL